jgi:hypothetical protein
MLLANRSGGARPLLFVGIAVLLGALVLVGRGKGKKLLAPDDEIGVEKKRAVELDRTQQALSRHRQRKHRLILALLAGQLRLLEAAAGFRALDRMTPEFAWKQFREHYPGDSDEERHCRHVITFAHAALVHDPARADEVRDRLDAELREYLRCGPLRLPDLDADLRFLVEED